MASSDSKTHALSTGLGLLALLIWSTSFAFARSIQDQAGPLSGAACIYLLGTVAGVLIVPVSYFTPLLATIVSCYYLHVPMGLGLWAACGLVVAGAVLSNRAVCEPPVESAQVQAPALPARPETQIPSQQNAQTNRRR